MFLQNTIKLNLSRSTVINKETNILRSYYDRTKLTRIKGYERFNIDK